MTNKPDTPNDSFDFEQLIRDKIAPLPQMWIKGITLGFMLFCLLMGLFGLFKVISTYAAQEKKSVIEEMIRTNNDSHEHE